MKTLLIIIQLLSISLGFSQNERIKNVIFLIPDGTSSDIIGMSRWYKQLTDTNSLAIDELICGMVKTHCSDNRFPDSAPTSTAYATGVKSLTGYIGVDSAKTPQISVLELAKLKGLSTGLVVTCEYSNATPADFVCHYPNRKKNSVLTQQFIFNSPTVVFSGGKGFLDTINLGNSLKDFNNSKFKLIDNKSDFLKLKYNNEKAIWGLFSDYNNNSYSKSYECDRNDETEPSLSEMTEKALDILKENKKGFFLMVEGSQIDWACHANDPYAAVTDFIEFDKSIKIALDYAKTNDSTLVIVCPDHGNGGIRLGNFNSNSPHFNKNPKNKYDKISIPEQIIKPLHSIKWSARKLTEKIIDSSSVYLTKEAIKEYYNLTLSDNLFNEIKKLAQNKKSDSIEYILGRTFSDNNFIGWTTTGHTAEDVFLGIYNPIKNERMGIIDNTDIAFYIAKALNLGSLNSDSLYFNKLNLQSDKFNAFKKPVVKDGSLVFVHKTDKNKTVQIPSNKNYYLVGSKKNETQTLIVEINSNYFVPIEIIEILNNYK